MRDDLRARYGEERLPRYTSYPTAPHFSPSVSRDTYAGWLASIAPETTASLYLHVPFCRSMLVLRLPHHRHAASRAYRRIHRGAAG